MPPTSGGSLVSNLEKTIHVLRSERDSDYVASSDRFESDPGSPGAARVEVALKMDIVSISPT
jgi:hypothetical protein